MNWMNLVLSLFVFSAFLTPDHFVNAEPTKKKVSQPNASELLNEYEVTLSNGMAGWKRTIEFKLNELGEIELFDEEGELFIQNFEVFEFFGSYDFELEWGSDEDRHYFLFSLEKQNDVVVLSKNCSVYFDAPNDYYEFEDVSISVKSWDAKTKKYTQVPIVQSEATFKKCQEELKERFINQSTSAHRQR